MLLIGLPLTIVAGTVAGTLIFPAIPLVEVAILAKMLAPTDAALGKSVLEDKNIPASIRTCLNVESGLNDGLSVPILFALLAAASHASSGGFGALTLGYLVEEVGIGVIVGGVVATAAFYILREGESRGWIGHSWRAILLVALAVAIFSLTQHVEGSGFIAVFVGGLILNNLHPDHKGSLLHGAEGVGELMAMSTWVIFGAIVVPLAIVHFTWQILLYIVLSLTVVRMLPIAISLIGSGIGPRTSVFLGWFGPRGLASIVFGVMIIGKGLTFQEPLILVVTCAVILSVFVHGASATMLGERLGPRLKEIEAG
jgi:sodium/hydrogen antiporter